MMHNMGQKSTKYSRKVVTAEYFDQILGKKDQFAEEIIENQEVHLLKHFVHKGKSGYSLLK